MKKVFYLMFFALTVVLQSAVASTWTDRGNYSITWFNKSQSSFVINTSAELAGVAYLVNNGYTTFKGVTLVLGEDIFLNEHEWVAIGTNSHACFQGTFDGNNHSIYDIRMSSNSIADDQHIGFFSYIKDALIRNLYLQFNTFSLQVEPITKMNIGKVAGYAESCEIRKVSATADFSLSTGKITGYGSYYFNIGGLIGIADKCNLYYCQNLGSLYMEMGALYDKDNYNGLSIMVGGIAGKTEIDVSYIIKYDLYGCENKAGITAKTGSSTNATPFIRIAGIVGWMSNHYINVDKCYNNAPYLRSQNGSSKRVDAYIGGISCNEFISPYSGGHIHNCYSSTTDLTAGAWLHTLACLYYGGVTSEYREGTSNLYSSNFSPSDITVTPYNVGKDPIPLIIGFNGDDSFTREEMKGQEFLDMLNVYSLLNEGKVAWENKKIGETFPSLIQDVATGVENVSAAERTTPKYKFNSKELVIDAKGDVTIYNIEGKKVFASHSYQGEPIKIEGQGVYVVKCNKTYFKISGM